MELENLFTTKIQMKTFQKKFLADIDTPISTYLKLAKKDESFLLESLGGNAHNSRYSIIGIKPMLIFKRFSNITIISDPIKNRKIELEGNPFDHLKSLLNSFCFDKAKPFECGLLCGYFSYDSIRYIEKIPANAKNDLHLPEMYLILPSELVIFDNFTYTKKLIVHIEKNGNQEHLDTVAEKRLGEMLERLSCFTPNIKEISDKTLTTSLKLKVNIANDKYLHSVKRAKDYIRNGDIFQVVLSRRFETEIECDSFYIYRMLHSINPSPYMFHLDFADIKLTGASPETMVRYDGNRITVRPIAGTRKRGKSTAKDREIAQELLHDEKELAEHVMLVDLGRNDVGRIASYGSVQIDTFKQVENYSHVMHIVSNVSGKLREDLDAVDIFQACFPAGTVSGAPKVRAMEIIDELEQTQRGPYAGALGYFDFSGRMDTCITIRTVWTRKNTAYWQAGGGIVADSIPELELEETENKAKAMLKAITIAEGIHHDSSN